MKGASSPTNAHARRARLFFSAPRHFPWINRIIPASPRRITMLGLRSVRVLSYIGLVAAIPAGCPNGTQSFPGNDATGDSVVSGASAGNGNATGSSDATGSTGGTSSDGSGTAGDSPAGGS